MLSRVRQSSRCGRTGLRQYPELTRDVGAVRQVGLVVVWSPAEDIQAHAGATEQRRQAKGAVGVLHESPRLAGDVIATW